MNSINNQMGTQEWLQLIFLSILWGGLFFFSRVALAELKPFAVVFGRVLIAGFALHIIVRASGHRMPTPSLNTWGALVGLVLLSTALAYILYFRLLSSVGATNLLLVIFLIHVVAILLGTIILVEQLAIQHIAGMGFIGLGLIVIDVRSFGKIGLRDKIKSRSNA